MRRSLSIALLGAVGLLLPTKACADLTMVEGASFGPGILNIIGIKPFNPALGTLKSVDVTLQGTVSANLDLLPCGPGGPCPYQLVLDQNYVYTFTFYAFTDLVGSFPNTVAMGSGTLVPPSVIDGKLSNFEPKIVNFNEIDEILSGAVSGSAALGSFSD